MSKSLRKAQRRSFSSFSDSAGTLTATPGRLDALVVAHGTGNGDLGDHIGVGDAGGLQLDIAIVDEDAVAGLHVGGQSLVGG